MKRSFTPVLAIAFALAFIITASAADENIGASEPNSGPMAQEQKLMNSKGAARSGFSVILGNVSKIDTTDPSKIKIEVADERDNQLHVVGITPSTSITKVTDISELKAGDAVRIMVRKADDKETAVGVMFGNLKKLPMQKTPAPAEKETPKK